jgi:transcription initiation factor IIE alpha subunit
MTPQLFDVRCPYERLAKKDGKLYVCNSLCVRVTPGSAGEARCRKCGLNFEFEVDSRARLTTGVRVKKVEDEIKELV